jgi:RND family efflux transporter MFP subunit
MKVLKIIIVVLLFGGGIAFLLMRNKATMEAKAEQPMSLTINVQTQAVEEQTLTENLVLNGTMYANNEVPVIAETQGRVIRVFASLGERVSAGSALAKVDTTLKYSSYLLAKNNLEKAKRDLDRLTALRKENNASDNELEGAELAYQNAKAQFIGAERQFSDALIKSPISGTVVERQVNIGTMVMPGMPVATVVDISTLKLRANVPEQAVLKLRNGEKVRVSVDVYPGVNFSGTIGFISVRGNDAHSYPIEVLLPNNSQHPIKSGMSAKIYIESKTPRTALMLPRLAIVGSSKQANVYVLEQDNGKTIAKQRQVTLGAEKGTNIEVISGIQRGERVVTVGQNNVRNGSEVVVVQ